MKTTIILGLAILAFALKMQGAVHVITQSGFSFSPSAINVYVGDTIRWQWTAGSHTTTSVSVPDGAQSWNNPLNSSSVSFDYVIEVAGTYDYICVPHQGMGMGGSFTADTPTILRDKYSATGLSVTNPFSDNINVYLSDVSTIQITVWDITGGKRFSSSINSKERITIETFSWPEGIYILTGKLVDGKEFSKKIVKKSR